MKIISFLLFLAIFAAGPCEAANLVVRVVGVSESRGDIRASLCTEKDFLGEGCPYDVVKRAEAGLTLLEFRDVPPGRYALQLFHDKNGNQEFDSNFIGIPAEGFGFSRDAPLRGRPSFKDAVFDLPDDGANIMVTMRYSIF